MPTVTLETGQKLKFPEGTSEGDIHFAVDEYIKNNDIKPVDEVKTEAAKEESQGFLKTAGQFAMGLPQGLGNKFVGATQTLTSALGGSDTKFAKNLAKEVTNLKQRQSELPSAERAGITGGEIYGDLALSPTKGLGVVGQAATGGLVSGLTTPLEESGTGARLEEAGKQTATGAAFGKGLKTVGEGYQAVKPSITQFFAKATPIKSVRENLARNQAINKLRTGIAKEGADASSLLNEAEKQGVDLIDIVDPRFRLANESTKSLNRRGTIQIADQSLKKINENVDKIQDSVLDMISTNKITPEKAGEILGRNSKKIFDEALLARRAKAAPLYKRGLESGTKISLQTKLGESSPEIQDLLEVSGNDLTLEKLLKSPVVQSAISGARSKAAEFANSPAEEIYGKIYQKTKPIYATKTTTKDIIENPIVSREEGFYQPISRDIKLGAAATNIAPEYTTKTALKTKPQYKIPDNDVRVLHAVDNILYDKINEIGLAGANKEQTALSLVRNKISNLLDNANPDLRKARKLWKADTEKILSEKQSLVGKYAKLYKDGRIDELTKSALDVLKLPVNRILQAKSSNQAEFNDLLRTSIENKIASIAPLDESAVVKPSVFRNALFGKNDGAQLKAAIGDDNIFNGIKKLADSLDVQFRRNRIAKNAMESTVRNNKIPTGKFTLLNRAAEGAYDAIINNPMAQKKFVEFMFTEEGKNALRELSKVPISDKKAQEKLLNHIIKGAAITGAETLNQ